MSAGPVPVQFFQVAATVIPLMLITVGLGQAPMHPNGDDDKSMQLLSRLTALSAAVLGLAGALAALRFGSNPLRLGLTVAGLAFGFVHLVYGLALKIVLDLDLKGRAHRVSLWVAFAVALGVVTFALIILTNG